MSKTDESKRIHRTNNYAAQNYLASIKGEAYKKYRKSWEECSNEQIKLEKPLQINIEITSVCNLKCKMCSRNYPEFHNREGILNQEQFNELLLQIKEIAPPSIWISGGEPLTHPDIKEIIKKISNMNPVDFWIVSNGLLLTEELSDLLVNSSLTWLSISIDATNKNTYRTIRGGDYELLMRNIESFLRIRAEKGRKTPFLRVSFVDMAVNHSEIDDFKKIWSEKADIIDIQTLADYRKIEEVSDEEAYNSEYKCTAPFTLISVLPNGDIIPCCNSFFPSSSNYNIKNIRLLDYWNSTLHTNFANSIKEKRYCNECLRCVKSFVKRTG